MTSPPFTILHVRDADAYAATVRSIDRLTLLGRGSFEARVERCQLGDLTLQRVLINQPVTASLTSPVKLVVVGFSLCDQPSESWNGTPLAVDEIIVHRPGEAVEPLGRARPWGSLTVPLETLQAQGFRLGRTPLEAGRKWSILRPPPRTLARLRELHQKTISFLAQGSDVWPPPAIIAQMEEDLMRALLETLPGEPRHNAASEQRGMVLRRLKSLLDADQEGSLSAVTLCETLNISQRTLNRVCREGLGMGPQRYLKLLRLDRTRAALLSGTELTVGTVAVQHGFWEFGRFSADYRERFGELPSATLRRGGSSESATAAGIPAEERSAGGGA